MPHPDGLPNLFIDRSLGRLKVPRLLREAGLSLVTLAERYGVPEDETVSDETWLKDAGELGEVVFLKDRRVRYNEAEKAAIVRYSVRCFCIPRADLDATVMAARFVQNLHRIVAACAAEGPFVYAVHDARIDLLAM